MLRNPVSNVVAAVGTLPPLSPHSLSCDADDEDVTEMSGGATRVGGGGVVVVNNQDDEQPLDMSCKGVNGRKRSCGNVEPDGASLSGGGEQEGGKKRKVSAAAAASVEAPAIVAVGNKRKLLRKRRRNKRGGGGSGGEIVRASVISFAPGSLGSGGGYTSSSSSGGDEEEERRRARLSRGLKRKRIETCHADVEEHFRRSLGGIYDRITAESVKRDVVVVNTLIGPQAERNSSSRRSSADGVGSVVGGGDTTNNHNITPKLLFEESIRPSDVDDHFAKALGSETWSKIVNNARAVSAGPSPSSTPIPLTATPPLPPDDLGAQQPITTTQPPPPPPQKPVSKTSSSSYKIESILGTSGSNNVSGRGGAKSERGASPGKSGGDDNDVNGAVISSSWDRVVLKPSSAST